MTHDIQKFRDAIMVYGGLIMCCRCSREANPQAPIFAEAEYVAQAELIFRQGWTLLADEWYSVLCPECSAKVGT